MVNYKKPSKEKKQQLIHNMKTRCYNKNYHKVNPNYAGCTVCDEWLEDKEAFYAWIDNNFYEREEDFTVQLDKDILVPGNKIYSPNTCIFAPKRINALFAGIHGRSIRENNFPVGVGYEKHGNQYKYRVRPWLTDMNSDDEELKTRKVHLGFFDTIEEAYEVYKTHKMAEIIYIADSYKDVIPDKLYQAMINWKFDEIAA